MLWLTTYLTRFPPVGLYTLSWTHCLVLSAPRAVTSLLPVISTDPRSWSNRVNALTGYYLIATNYLDELLHLENLCVNALTGYYLIATKIKIGWIQIIDTDVSMPSRAITSLLQYPFKNLGFMRLPEPAFAGICQNILTGAVFYAC